MFHAKSSLALGKSYPTVRLPATTSVWPPGLKNIWSGQLSDVSRMALDSLPVFKSRTVTVGSLLGSRIATRVESCENAAATPYGGSATGIDCAALPAVRSQITTL